MAVVERTGRYVLGDVYGRGGIAEVVVGSSAGSRKPVAIKRLLPEYARKRAWISGLIREAHVGFGLQHRNIVPVLDLVRDGRGVFVVMELVDGPTLRQLLRACRNGELSLETACYIVQSVAAGLGCAHAQPDGGIVHGDVSPENILLSTAGQVLVSDFGNARPAGTVTKRPWGKWAYMAPEQMRGGALTPRSDVFSLGVILYELITGRDLFPHPGSEEQRAAHTVIARPRTVRSEIPRGLDAICMRALARDPRRRFRSMTELSAALATEQRIHAWDDGRAELASVIEWLATAGVAPGVATQTISVA